MEVLPLWLNDYLGDLRWGLLSPQQTRITETEKTFAGGIGIGPSDNDVVEQFDVDGFGSFAKLSRHVHVRCARRGIATGVVVRADDARGGFADGGAKNLARVRERGGGRTGGDLDAFDQTIFAIETEH